MSEKQKKPFYKKWWVWVLAVIIIGAIALNGGNSTKPASTEPTKETKTETKKEENRLVGIGQPLKVGDVTFTVYGTSTTKSVGPKEFGQKAQGTYLIIDVGVKNEGKKAITIDSSFFKLKSGDTEYDADATADVYINEAGGGFFLKNVNPGVENKGKIAFDIPTDAANSKDLILNVQTGFLGTEQGQIKLSK